MEDLGYAPLLGAPPPAPHAAAASSSDEDAPSTSSSSSFPDGGIAATPADARWASLASTDLDAFLTRVYRFWHEKGLTTIATARVLNLAALAFTAAFSFTALLVVQWRALGSACVRAGTCDISEAALNWHPFRRRADASFSAWTMCVGLYLGAFALYWFGAAAAVALDLHATAAIARFYRTVLGLSERQTRAVPWAEVARRLVEAQRGGRLVLVREGGAADGPPIVLEEADLVARIMRRDNLLIALLGSGALALTPPRRGPVLGKARLPAWLSARAGGGGASFTIRLPRLGPARPALPRVLEWNLRAAALDPLFAARPDTVDAGIASDPAALASRFRRAALLNAAAAPFALLFLSTFGFMRHAERFYHHPSSAASRRWSPLASWALREFNELPHYADHRLAGAGEAAGWYLRQFPAHAASHAARFVAFVAGSLAALLLLAAALDDHLLERPLYGRHVVWWVAGLGLVLAAARGVAGDEAADAADQRAPEPERALASVCAATHYRPRHWRGRAHAREVRGEVGRLFRFRAALFLQEASAVLFTPFLLWWALPACAPALCAFVREHTVTVPGVGDVVDAAAWGGEEGGGAAGAPSTSPGRPPASPARAASRLAPKVEASIASFAAAYPTWCPRTGSAAAGLVWAVAARMGGGGEGEGGAASPGLNPLAAAAAAWPAWGWGGGGKAPAGPPHGGLGLAATLAASGGPAAAADDHGRVALAHLALQVLVDEADGARARGGGEEVAWPAAAAAPSASSRPPASAPRPTPPVGGGLTHELAAVSSWAGSARASGGGGGAPATPSPPGGGAALLAAPSADGGGDPCLLVPPPPPPGWGPGGGGEGEGEGDGRSSGGGGGGGVFGPPSGASSGSEQAAGAAPFAAWGAPPPVGLGLEEQPAWGGGGAAGGGGPPDLI